MSISRRVREYLDANDIPYEWLPHSQAYTSQEVAHSLHVSGKRLAKTVVLDADGRLVMAVLPAAYRLSLGKMQDAIKAKRIELLAESELATLFPATWEPFPPSGISTEWKCGWTVPSLNGRRLSSPPVRIETPCR